MAKTNTPTVRTAILRRLPLDNLRALIEAPKDSSSIHYDEDTIPHGDCTDPIHCDCCCPKCWRMKADIIRAGVDAIRRCQSDEPAQADDAVARGVDDQHEPTTRA